MPGSFVDTSALAKHYHVEPGSAQVDRLWSDLGRTLFISRVGVVEVISVFAGKARGGVLSTSAFTVLRKRFLSDVGQGRPKLVRMLVQHFQGRRTAHPSTRTGAQTSYPGRSSIGRGPRLKRPWDG
jgi:hypothetical protein